MVGGSDRLVELHDGVAGAAEDDPDVDPLLLGDVAEHDGVADVPAVVGSVGVVDVLGRVEPVGVVELGGVVGSVFGAGFFGGRPRGRPGSTGGSVGRRVIGTELPSRGGVGTVVTPRA